MVTSIDASELRVQLRAPRPPRLVDVRRAPAFAQSDATLEDAVWLAPDEVDSWAHTLPAEVPVVVYCVHGHEVSQGCARRLVALGLAACYLEGGFEGWRAGGGRVVCKTGGPA